MLYKIDKDTFDLWSYVTYKMLAMNSSFVFPLEYFFDTKKEIDSEQIKKLVDTDEKGLYIHIPFCIKICDYCGCYKQKIDKNDDLDRYVDAIIKELEIIYRIGGNKKLRFSTCMFGGGTASILTPDQLDRLFQGIYTYIEYDCIEQVSFESAPFTLTHEKIDVLKKHSVHRMSLGVQSFQKEVLQQNNRIYVSYESLKDIISYIQSLGILVQIDLMIGIKGQSEENCIDDYKKMMDLGVDSYTMNYYIPHGFANFSDSKRSLALKEKMRKLDEKMNNITKDMGAYLLQEEYVFTRFRYGVLGLGVGATSNINNRCIYRKTDFKNYYDSLERGMLPVDDGIEVSEKFPYIKYIFEKYKEFEIDMVDFMEYFGVDFLGIFQKEIDILEYNGVVKIEENKIKFLKNKFESRIYLTVFLDEFLQKKTDITLPKIDRQFHLDLMGLIYE